MAIDCRFDWFFTKYYVTTGQNWPPNVTLKESKLLGIMGLDLSFSQGDTD